MRPTGLPGMEIYRGPAGFRRFCDEWLEAFPDAHQTLEQVELADDALWSTVRQEMRGGGGGVPVTIRYAAVGRLDEDVLRALEFHTDLEAARRRFDELVAASSGKGG